MDSWAHEDGSPLLNHEFWIMGGTSYLLTLKGQVRYARKIFWGTLLRLYVN